MILAPVRLIKNSLFLLVSSLLIVVSIVNADDLKKISLSDYAQIVATSNKISIFIDEDIEANTITFYNPGKLDAMSLFDAFKISLDKHDLKMLYRSRYYYLTKKAVSLEESHKIKLDNNIYEQISPYLLQKKIKHAYIQNINMIYFDTTREQFEEIRRIIKAVDKESKQVTIKFTIFETSNRLTDEGGFRWSSIYKDASGAVQIALDTLVYPFSSNNPILHSADFFGALTLLHKTDDVEIKQFPFVLAKNNKPFIFEAVNNIPYLESTNTIESANSSSQVSYNYRDVGLKINGKLLIYDTHADLDLKLTIEDLITSQTDQDGNILPITTKRYLESNTKLNFDDVLILSGINQTKDEVTNIEIPILSGIPFLGNMFKYKYSTKDTKQLTIAIQLIRQNMPSDSEYLPPPDLNQ